MRDTKGESESVAYFAVDVSGLDNLNTFTNEGGVFEEPRAAVVTLTHDQVTLLLLRTLERERIKKNTLRQGQWLKGVLFWIGICEQAIAPIVALAQ